MAGKSAIMSVKIIADAKRASGEVGKFEQAIGKLQGTVDKMTVPAAVAGGALVAFGKQAADAAAEAEQNFGAVNTVFSTAADKVHQWAVSSAQDVGMSASSYEALAASIGGSLQTAGYSADEMATKTNDLINAGADLSSVFGGDAAEAASAMGAALRGEFDPLERFGVFMSMNAVSARMAAEGTAELEGAAFEQAKKQAIVNEIMAQAATYQGNFAREADTAAGAQQRASAEFENAKAQLGEALLPYIVEGSRALADMARWVSENSSTVTTWAAVLGSAVVTVFGMKAALTAITTTVGIVNFFRGATAAVQAYRAGLSLATAAQVAHAGAAGSAGARAAMFLARIREVTIALAAKTAALARSGVAAAAASARWLIARAAAVAVRVATIAWTAAQRLLNLALRANPIGLIITAVGALVAAFVWAYNNVDWFRQGVDKAIAWVATAWNQLSQFFLDTVNAWSRWFGTFGNNVISVFRSIGDWVNGVARNFRDMFSGVRMPAWASRFLGSHGALVSSPIFYETGHPTLPFTVHAASNPLEAIFARPESSQTIINNNYTVENNFNNLVTDPLAVAREVQSLLDRLNQLTKVA
ncbi:hypothetical protein E4U03_07790 [Rothia nasimurium]|uniref:Phage tail tape measure protein n=1 Tax=Rothia nasimurium TaxID=85336 RepID=A0A4Y9F2L8_9MICC|nr:hypothetical protein [Rothia nasimurium]MBF0808509.1 hypothetical protein [Rothia nasimurium]TFU21903.1 hypothetical protein E4U03_07790 [Rothia nasimurium]